MCKIKVWSCNNLRNQSHDPVYDTIETGDLRLYSVYTAKPGVKTVNFWQSIHGMLILEITSAEPETFIQVLYTQGITLHQIEISDSLTFRCCIKRSDFRCVKTLCKKYGNRLEIRKYSGLYWKTKRFINRPVLVLCLSILVFLILFVPTRILFISTEGNHLISERKILEAAENCGIKFGASRRAVRSEKIKNELLSAVPDLQWAGINTKGCHAVISVREREQIQTIKSSSAIAKMVAVRDGIITSCAVTKGNAVCSVGQPVQKGQQLISPYIDCGIVIKAVPVEGEVYGRTKHFIHAVMPAVRSEVMSCNERKRSYSIIIGKKRINLWKGSGISDTICGRMYEEYCITLPGGFQLPVYIGIETVCPRKISSSEITAETADTLLHSFASDYVRSQMIAGTILLEDTDVHIENGIWLVRGEYICEEMIGRITAERNGEMNE